MEAKIRKMWLRHFGKLSAQPPLKLLSSLVAEAEAMPEL
jgi:hypothetical protein